MGEKEHGRREARRKKNEKEREKERKGRIRRKAGENRRYRRRFIFTFLTLHSRFTPIENTLTVLNTLNLTPLAAQPLRLQLLPTTTRSH